MGEGFDQRSHNVASGVTCRHGGEKPNSFAAGGSMAARTEQPLAEAGGFELP